MSRPRPNIVLIIADQHRWDFTGWDSSNGVTDTPQLDALAARGFIARRAYCTAPLCSPSRAALALGRYSMNSGCYTNLHQPAPGSPTFVNQLREHGYRTCAVGKTHMAIHAYDADYTTPAHAAFQRSLGWQETHEISGNGMLKTGIVCAYSQWLREHGLFDDVLAFYRHWIYFMDPEPRGSAPFVCHEFDLPEEAHETAWVTRRAVDWIEDRAGRGPFLLHVGYAAPHSPIEPLPRLMDRYRERSETPAWNNPAPKPTLDESRRGYRAMITEVDEGVGQIVAALERLGQLDNTIIIYTADHGELAGDHGADGKTCFFEAAERIPFAATGPGIGHGESDALVELLDVGATCCELAGVPAHGLDQGRSLRALMAGETDHHRETVFAEMGCDKMLFDGRYKLMYGDPKRDTRKLGRLHLDKPVTIPASPPRLYDLAVDPREEHDLADQPGYATLRREMLEKLLARLNENVQPRPNLSRGEYRPL